MPKPPGERAASTPWPLWPLQLRTEGAHEEGGIRDWSINSIKFTGDEHGNVKQMHRCPASWDLRQSSRSFQIAGSEFTMDVDLVLLAMGFLGPVKNGMIEQLGLALDNRGNVATNANYMSSVDGSLRRGRYAARSVARGVGDCRGPQGSGLDPTNT